MLGKIFHSLQREKILTKLVDYTNTPSKRGANQSDQPLSKTISWMVAWKNLDMEKEMPDEIEGYEKGDIFCKFCK